MLGQGNPAPLFIRPSVPYSTTAEWYPTYSGGTVRAARLFTSKDAQERAGDRRAGKSASGIAVKSPEVRDEPRTCNGKPGPKETP